MNEVASPNARLILAGHQAVPARLDATARPTRTRAIRAVLWLVGLWVLAPVVFFIPPHIPWVLGAFFGGIYMAYTQWNGHFIVNHFEGSCPRCSNPLTIKPGTKIRLPHRMTCYNCHQQPTLEANLRGA